MGVETSIIRLGVWLSFSASPLSSFPTEKEIGEFGGGGSFIKIFQFPFLPISYMDPQLSPQYNDTGYGL